MENNSVVSYTYTQSRICCVFSRVDDDFSGVISYTSRALRERKSLTRQLITSILLGFSIFYCHPSADAHSPPNIHRQLSYSKHHESTNLHQNQIVIQVICICSHLSSVHKISLQSVHNDLSNGANRNKQTLSET